MRRPALFVILLMIAALACNAPTSDGDDATPTAETVTPTEEATVEGSDTVETAVPTSSGPSEPTPLPTVTAIPPKSVATESASATPKPSKTPAATETTHPTATTGATATIRATSTLPATSTIQAALTATSEGSGGPLSFTYNISWRVKSGDNTTAIATVAINATGGGGGYSYYRDDIPAPGPIFEYEWATCRANPGSLRVDSADGQSVRVEYYETPPCPEN